MDTLAAAHPNLNESHLLQATAASYNFGTGNISGDSNRIDLGTTENNYGSNVLLLMDFFWGMTMRKDFLDFFLITVMCVVACSLFLSASGLAQSRHEWSSSPQDSLKKFLQEYAGSPRTSNGETAEYVSAFVDLKDDGTQEVVAYLVGPEWCGSGGCTTLILAPKDSSYKVITKITISRPPIRVLTTKTNGWHDIAVQVHGGGITRAYEAKLSFNGKTYPDNPSVLPARRLIKKVAGEVIVPFPFTGTPIY